MNSIFERCRCAIRPVTTVQTLILLATLSGFFPVEARQVVFPGGVKFLPCRLTKTEVIAEFSRQKVQGSKDTDPDPFDQPPNPNPVKPNSDPRKPNSDPRKPNSDPGKPAPQTTPNPNSGAGQVNQPSPRPVIQCSHCGQNHDVNTCPQLKPSQLMCSHCSQNHKSEACPSRRIFKRAFLGVLGCLVVGSMAVIGFRMVQLLRQS